VFFGVDRKSLRDLRRLKVVEAIEVKDILPWHRKFRASSRDRREANGSLKGYMEASVDKNESSEIC
jgi:hypothetical protein